MTKYHQIVPYTTEIHFLAFLEPLRLKEKWLTVMVSHEVCFLDLWNLCSYFKGPLL